MKLFNGLLVLVLNLCSFAGLYGQQTTKASGMTFGYEVVDNMLKCSLQAPTNGWVGVGFNTKNSIVGSDLLLFNVVNGKVSCTDLFVKGVGNPIKDSANGGKNTITLLKGTEKNSFTHVTFTIPMNSGDPNDFVHVLGKEAWLILAYSVDDDFAHHSRVRKHIPFIINDD